MATSEQGVSRTDIEQHGAVVSQVAFEEPQTTGAAVLAAPDVLANSLGDFTSAWWRRVKGGDSGVLPVIVALVVIVVAFELQDSLYLHPSNIINLINYSAIFLMFAMAEVFVLLLGEIDLSLVYVAGISSGLVAYGVLAPLNLPWYLAILLGLATGSVLGVINGMLIVYLRLPSFIVTLAGWIGWQGLMLFEFNAIPGASGGLSIKDPVLTVLNNSSPGLSPIESWIVMAVLVVAFGAYLIARHTRRQAEGLAVPPMSLTVLKVLAIAVAGVVIVLVCNANRGVANIQEGVPWCILIILGVYAAANFLLSRTKFGRYVYAIGGNTEAARRAGINVGRVRIAAFGCSGLLASIAGIMYMSESGGINTNIDPNYVLYAVGAAVIGGASLFGGRGKPIHAILGALVVGGVYSGIFLMSLGADVQYIVVALVLLVAVTVDSVARRGGGTSGGGKSRFRLPAFLHFAKSDSTHGRRV
ncbi:MAG TPA: hypothetical protein VFN61_08830 [Acidimicrobiales bacterium]|nr:hypothetical protein [Acidimicrobiales bacterium]